MRIAAVTLQCAECLVECDTRAQRCRQRTASVSWAKGSIDYVNVQEIRAKKLMRAAMDSMRRATAL